MNALNFESLVSHPVFVATGWTLLHFLWQAAIIVLIFSLLLRLFRQSSAQSRYLVSCVGLVVMAIVPLLTCLYLVSKIDAQAWGNWSSRSQNTRASQQFYADPAAESPVVRLQNGNLVEQHSIQVTNQTDIPAFNPDRGAAGLFPYTLMLKRTLPILVTGWLLGVFLFALRLLIGLDRVRKMRRICVESKSPQLTSAMQTLIQRIKIAYPVQLLESAQATVPAVVGIVRPVVIVPASMLTGLTTTEMEAILAHELAHIKRHDYLVNLIQSVIEALLFYHPAVWWMSNQIRLERENCCDDIAVSICGDAMVYARALTCLEAYRCDQERLAVAANGGSLLHRVRRIVGTGQVKSGTPWQAGAIAMGSLAAVVSGFWISAVLATSSTGYASEPGNPETTSNLQLLPTNSNLQPTASGRQESEGRKVTVTSNNSNPIIVRQDRAGVKVLATHRYDQKRRESTGWVKVDGVSEPIDVAVEHAGYSVYFTLMYDVVAVEKKTGNVAWKLDWGKTTPIWQTVSIVELGREQGHELAVELVAIDNKSKNPIYKYVSLANGDEVKGPSAAGKNESPKTVNDLDVEGWGGLAHHSGLRSRLTLQTKDPQIGAPIQFKLEVKNFGDNPCLVDPQKYAAFRVLRVQHPDRTSVPFIGMTQQTFSNQVQLEPGESLTLWERVDVNSLFLINSGKSRIFAEGGEWAMQALWRDSNTLELDIARGNRTPVMRFISELTRDLPKDWNVANGFGLADGGKGIYLTHAPTSLKRDATGIQIWFTEEKLAEDFQLGKGEQQQTVTQLGKCELGYLNIAARPKTPEVWPGYVKQIRAAASKSLSMESSE